MSFRRLLSVVAALTVCCLLFSDVAANAADISAEKANLMAAAGVLPAVQIQSEDSAKVKKDAAIKIAKSVLEDPASFEMTGSSFNMVSGAQGHPGWNFEFMRRQMPGGNANITVDADTGELLGFNTWTNTYVQQNYIAKFTRPEALSIAESFLRDKVKVSTEGYELQKEDPNAYGGKMNGVKGPVTYNLIFVKKVNGALLSNDNISICVDGTNGKVTSYYRSKPLLDESLLPSADGILTPDIIMEKYRDSVHLSLQYISIYPSSYGPSSPKTILAYIPSPYTDMLDASNGKAVYYDGTVTDLTHKDLLQTSLTPVPMSSGVLPECRKISDEEAKNIADGYKKTAEDMLGVRFDAGGNGQPYMSSSSQGDFWSCSWNKNDGTLNYNFYISVNKDTGHIVNLSMGKYDYEKEKLMAAVASGKSEQPDNGRKVEWSRGKEIVLDTVKKLVPDMYGFYSDQNFKEPALSEDALKYTTQYNYSFTRVVNGILFRDNSIGVGIDRTTGEVKSFYFNWTDCDFPGASTVITQDEAASRYFKGTEAKLLYFQKSSFVKATGVQKTEPVPMLVYSFTNKGYAYGGGVYVDASSGKLIDAGGREIRDMAQNNSGGTQMGESWAKRSIDLLAAQGIVKDPYADCDAGLTRAEAVKMLTLAKGYQYYNDMPQELTPSFTDVRPEDSYYPYIEGAARQKIITAGGEFKGSGTITREEFAKLLVNTIGYSDIAGHPAIYKLDGLGLKAVDPDNAGYVAICSALGILPVKDGDAYDGSVQVTFAEAASALYRALSYIK